MDRHQRELGLMLGVKAIGILIAGYLAWWGIMSFQWKEDAWPPSDAADEDRIIARYKQRLQIGDSPVSGLTPEQAATYLGRIIDHAVKKGDRKTAREYAGLAIDRKVDATAEKHIGQADARDLLTHTLAGRVKRDDLQRLADTYAKRPPDSAPKDVRDRFNRDFDDQVREFVRTPFRGRDCPELAAEIVGIYQSKLAPHRADPRLKAVTTEVEQNCTPPKP